MRLTERQWRARERAHQQRVDAWTAGHRERAGRGEAHPVEDFLFTYYSHRPSHLRRWSPGAGVELEGHPLEEPWVASGAAALLGPPPDRVRRSASWVVDLLTRTAARPAQFGCFGLHEWAMVYRDTPRHRDWPLRLGEAGTDAVVEALPLRCSHHDAFRFFTPGARPLNALQPQRADQAALEQGGCLHANMDLYKWSYKLSPWVPSELVADCFGLARRVRVLDMRASPYDFTALGLDPVRVEQEGGRQEYAAAQRAFAAEAAVLRDRLRAAAALVS
ncbi:MAG: 3-methyladenine DNA glycosylase [Mycobacteriales bacterium]